KNASSVGSPLAPSADPCPPSASGDGPPSCGEQHRLQTSTTHTRTADEGVEIMSRLSLPPFSRRSLLTGLGAGAAGLGLAACGAPGGGDDAGDDPVRDGFGQADV